MTNLLQELMEVLSNYEKEFEDIEFISIDDVNIPIDDFKAVAGGINYDSGYGMQEINPTLLIVCDDCIFTRCEYDGAEWFEYSPRDFTAPELSLEDRYTIRKMLIGEEG